jgi:hypothetical protein
VDVIYDAAGKMIATVVAMGNGFTNVYDADGNSVGYSTETGTYKVDGQMVSSSPVNTGC